MREIEFRAYALGGNGETWFMLSPEQVAVDFEMHLYSEDSYLMQFTGLLDKNGVKIFEGDIIKYYYVAWNCGGLGDEYRVCAKAVYFENGEYIFPKNSAEVIGNIHQNPELLTNDKREE